MLVKVVLLMSVIFVCNFCCDVLLVMFVVVCGGDSCGGDVCGDICVW